MDRKSIGNSLIIGSICMATLASPPPVRACRLFDCFGCFGRKSTPVTAYTPVVTAPTVTAPAVAAAPAATCGPAQCQQTVLRYLPQVAYRTVWEPVPVTTYRRTVSTNPTTGLPITCTQPCTTYTYQARRVPYTTFRPVYTTEPVTAPAVATVPAPVATTVAPTTVAPAAPCSSCTPATSGLAYASPTTMAPYYTPPATSLQATPWTSVAPSGVEPSPTSPSDLSGSALPGATPWEPVPSNGTTAAPGSVPGSTDPADQRPQIPPTIEPNLNGFESQRPPTDANGPSGGTNGNGVNGNGVNGNGVNGNGSNFNGYLDEAQKSYSPSDTSVIPWTTVRPEINSPSTTTSQGARPLPRWNEPSESAGPDAVQAPPLLGDPRDRTAVRPIPARPRPVTESAEPIPTRWASSRIAWPDRPASHTVEVKAPVREWNDPPAVRPSVSDSPLPRRLDTQRVRLKRFDSDSSSTPPSHDERAGWRSARR